MKTSSIKKGKRTKRGWEAFAEQEKKNRQKKMEAEQVTSQGRCYKDEESEESNESFGSNDINSEEEYLDGEDDRRCKNDVVIEDPTTSMSLPENSEARQKEMEEEIRCLRKKNASKEKVTTSPEGFEPVET